MEGEQFDDGGDRWRGGYLVQCGCGATYADDGFGGEFGAVKEDEAVAFEDGGVDGVKVEELAGCECGEGVPV